MTTAAFRHSVLMLMCLFLVQPWTYANPAVPGTFVAESATNRSISNAPAGIAAFVGVAPSASLDGSRSPRPVLIQSWNEFTKKFSSFSVQPNAKPDLLAFRTLQHAVYGFFQNGGNRCWILPLRSTLAIKNLNPYLSQFESIREISIVAAPGITDRSAQEALIRHCEKTRNRVALLDGNPKSTGNHREEITSDLRASTYASVFYPWILVNDPIARRSILQPPSGHIAGMLAKGDLQNGVARSPGNARLTATAGLSNSLSDHDCEDLRQGNINVPPLSTLSRHCLIGLRTFSERNSQDEYRYLPHRRYASFLEESISISSQWVSFEQNASPTWSRLKSSVEEFLLLQWRNGALLGNRPDEAFFVHCGLGQTMNSTDIQQGRIVLQFGLALMRPAEFFVRSQALSTAPSANN